jgi:hypothetical protein
VTEAKGPIWAAGFEEITKSGYKVLFLPDVNNDVLQREGKPPVYWWLPNEVRLARRNGDSGDYLFSMLHFVGVRSETTHVGVEGREEVAGGLLGFSTTSAPPGAILKEATDSLIEKFRGKDTAYWGWRSAATPMFRPAPIVSNVTSVTDLNPMDDGAVPQPRSMPPASNGPPRSRAERLRASRPPEMVASTRIVNPSFPRSVPRGDHVSARSRGLDGWYAKLQGQGNGTVTPFAINSYSGMLGSYPAAMVWETFHGGSAAFTVYQDMQIRVWSPVVELTLEGEWDRIQDHFSAAAHAGWLWWGADIQAQFNELAIGGKGITVKCQVDRSLPDADKLEAELNKRKDLVFQTFMQQAQKTIFDPAPYNEKPAEATGGFLGWGGGVAFKLRRDQTHLRLSYKETTEYAYLQPFPIRGQLEGLHDEINADPANEKKYFRTLYLGDWDRKVSRIVTPVVNWPNPTDRWVGQPVAFLSAQVGYPNKDGVVQWDFKPGNFTASDPPNTQWTTSVEMKAAGDVTNAPPGWTPDKTFVKRKVHFTEPPNDSEYPNVRVQIERNVVDLDPGDLGSLVSDNSIEVRVDSVGILSVGPITLGAVLEGPSQLVEVTFRAKGKTLDGHDRSPVKFQWRAEGQDVGRYWFIFTGQADFVPSFEYQVRVVVRGTIFGGGQEWTGPWEEAGANGPLEVRIPPPDGQGVRRRSLNASRHRATPPPARRRVPAKAKAGAPPAVVAGPRAPSKVRGYPVGVGTSSTARAGDSAAGTDGVRFDSFSAVPPQH